MGQFHSLLVIGLLLVGTVGSAEPSEIRGKVLFSFEGPHYLIQSGEYILRLKKKSLNHNLQGQLEKVGSNVDISIPFESIDMAWKSWSDEDGIKRYVAVQSKDLRSVPKLKQAGSNLVIVGEVLNPLEKSYAFVQAGNTFLRLKRSNADVQKALDKASAGPISLKVPVAAIDFVWTTEVESKSVAKSSADVSSVSVVEDQLMIKGQMLHSFQEPYVLVQAKDHIFQIKKSALSPLQLSKMEKSPSLVSVIVPPEGISLSWKVYSIQEANELAQRVPASSP